MPEMNATTPIPPAEPMTEAEALHPYPNFSSFLLGNWFWMETNHSQASLRRLVDGVLSHNRFCPTDVQLNWTSLHDALAPEVHSGDTELTPEGWRRSAIQLEVPRSKRHMPVSREARLFNVPQHFASAFT